MADWEEPLDSQTDPDAPITSHLGKRWDNNVIAMAEGRVGAARISFGAFDRPSAGNLVRYRDDDEKYIISPTETTVLNFAFTQVGTVRVSWDSTGYISNNLYYTRLKRIRGGISTTIITNINTSAYATTSVDVSILPGDVITLVAAGVNSSNPTKVKNFRVKTSGSNLYTLGSDWSKIEGNTYYV